MRDAMPAISMVIARLSQVEVDSAITAGGMRRMTVL